VGVGIGGTFERAALLAKKSLVKAAHALSVL
jgi:tartrate dehydratase alpha subunit/fumarate hydratase class I-like protein